MTNQVLLSECALYSKALVWQCVHTKSEHRVYRSTLLGSEAVQRLWSACCVGLEEQFLVSFKCLEALAPTLRSPVGRSHGFLRGPRVWNRSRSCADTTKMPPSLLLLRCHTGRLRVQDLALRGVIRHWPQEIFLLVHLHVEYRVGVPAVNLRQPTVFRDEGETEPRRVCARGETSCISSTTRPRSLSTCYGSPTTSPVCRFGFYGSSSSRYSSAASQRPPKLLPIVTGRILRISPLTSRDAISSSASECRVENGG